MTFTTLMKSLLRLLPAVTLALAIMPLAASAQVAPATKVRCAVISTSPMADVFIGVGTVDNQAAVDLAGAVCTGLITTGIWQGASNEMLDARYAPVAAVWLSPVAILGVWANPDYGSTAAAYALVEQFSAEGYPIDYH